MALQVLFSDLDGTIVHYDVQQWGELAPRPDGEGAWECAARAAAGDGAFEFERTASRLQEMRSADYMSETPTSA